MYKEKLDKILLDIQKPSRYTGGEIGSVIKDKDKVDVRFAFCFPDTYDIGMSHLGMKILYSLKNNVENYWCERVFIPLPDMMEKMRENDILLYGLESLEPIKDFDFIGFTLQYELTYTNVLAMLDLADVPLLSSERTENHPIVVAGGPCACNPEPLCDFIDMFFIGEGEELNLEVMALYEECKKNALSKNDFLKKAAQIEGVYVPKFYDVFYNDDGTVKCMSRKEESGAPPVIKKRIIKYFDKVFYPENFVIPFTEIVHDRAVMEVLRGCIRGCRFCQAGFIYRPFREKEMDSVLSSTKVLCENTGYDEVSLSSLSTSDYHDIEGLLSELSEYTDENKISMSLPSLRIDKFSEEVLDRIKSVRKSGLTFAPEAGTQRLRDVINKNITDDDILSGCKTAFEGGYTNVKLYFMLGLPTETLEDIEGINTLAEKITDLYYSTDSRQKGKAVSISISLSTFIPKPFTPFEFEPQPTKEEIAERQKHLLSISTNRKVKISWSYYNTTILEAVLARGDRKLGKVILSAYKKGAFLDGWDEYFKFNLWEEAMAENNIDPAFYANRTRSYDEVMPWSHLDMLVSRDFLISENKKAHESKVTPNCLEKCSSCGVNSRQYKCNVLTRKEGEKTNKKYNRKEQMSTHGIKTYPVRIFFQKTGRAIYTSHLDLYRTMQRAVMRSGLPVWYTEGFNKHIYLTFALPLSLGISGVNESMDLKLTEDLPHEKVKEMLSAALISDLDIVEVAVPKMKNTAIKKAQYEITGEYDKNSFSEFLSQEKIITEKRTKKKGINEIDIKPHIDAVLEDDKITMTLPAGCDFNINPQLVIKAYENATENICNNFSITRTKILTECGEIFN